MNRHRASLGRGLVCSLVAAFTTWVALLAWRGFVFDYPQYVGPLFGFALTLAGVGAIARWARLPAALVALTQLALLALWLLGTYGEHGLALTLANVDSVVEAFRAGITSAQVYVAPVPQSVPSAAPLLMAGGGLIMILVDLLAVTLGRVPLAGLPLLLVYSLPVSIIGRTSGAVSFVVVAAGFLALLYLREDERFGQWGRSVDLAQPEAGVRAGNAGSNAFTIGLTVTTLALFVPVLIPEFHLGLLSGGDGPGPGGKVEVVNPITDLRTDLQQGQDSQLLVVTTDDPHPDYLKLAVLKNFDGFEWSTGSRVGIPEEQSANGQPMLPIQGLDPTEVKTVEYDYDFSAAETFEAHWLVVPDVATSAEASGNWRYDPDPRDFIAMENDLTIAGMRWSASGLKATYNARDLDAAPAPPIDFNTRYIQLTNVPQAVRAYTGQAIGDAPTKYRKAVALQEWFREPGRFTYTTDIDPESGSSTLTGFLSPDGRRGYCEQFASAYAAMARFAGLPARVVVGLINPEEIAPGTFRFTTHDMHAWPEVYFEDAGWVRFEPTPGNRANVPGHTRVNLPSLAPTELPSGSEATESIERPTAPTNTADPAPGIISQEGVGPFSWTAAVSVFLATWLLVGIANVPRLLRSGRRKWRWSNGTAEAAWLELRDVVHDLRLTWPEGRSPRAAAERLAGSLAALDESARPPLGADANPEAAAALDRLVTAVEVERYSGRALVVDPSELRRDVEVCEAGLAAGVSSGARRRARWLPASLRRSRGAALPVALRSSSESVVDRVT